MMISVSAFPSHLLVATGPSRLETQVSDLEILMSLLLGCYSAVFQKELHADSFKTRIQWFLTPPVQGWSSRVPASIVWVHFAMPEITVGLPWSQDLTRGTSHMIPVYFIGTAVLVKFNSRNGRNEQQTEISISVSIHTPIVISERVYQHFLT